MSDTPLTIEMILDAAEQLLRRFGPNKTTVIDVARALKVSHGTVYRHFPSKAALKEAVAERWLHRLTEPLYVLQDQPGSAAERVTAMLTALFRQKRETMRDDPEMFTMYSLLVEETVDAVTRHVDDLVAILRRIVEPGIESGEFISGDPGQIAAALFAATTKFHHPAHAKAWTNPAAEEELLALIHLLLAGLVKK